jgi:hypothetical protein
VSVNAALTSTLPFQSTRAPKIRQAASKACLSTSADAPYRQQQVWPVASLQQHSCSSGSLIYVSSVDARVSDDSMKMIRLAVLPISARKDGK